MDILVYLFKNKIHEGLNINPFKNEEGDKTSVDNTHTQRACERELTVSPVVSDSHSPTIDAEYVFVSPNIVFFFFNIALINVYLINNQEINQILVSFVMLNLSANLWFLVISIISIGYELTWIMLYHTLSWCCHYLGLSIHLTRKGGHESSWIIHQDNSNLFTSIFQRWPQWIWGSHGHSKVHSQYQAFWYVCKRSYRETDHSNP